MFENPTGRRGRQARNFTANVPKILQVDLKSSSEQIFSENLRWLPLTNESNTYEDSAVSVFNHLPAEVRIITDITFSVNQPDIFYRFCLISICCHTVMHNGR